METKKLIKLSNSNAIFCYLTFDNRETITIYVLFPHILASCETKRKCIKITVTLTMLHNSIESKYHYKYIANIQNIARSYIFINSFVF